MELTKREKEMEKEGVVFLDVSKARKMTTEEMMAWKKSQRYEPKSYRTTEDGFPEDWQ